MELKYLTGSVINAFFVCKRQAWLLAHQILPDEDFVYLELGRLTQQQTFKKYKKEYNVKGIKIDLIFKEKKALMIGEVKKSSRSIKSAKMQLIYYLYKLNNMGLKVKGILFFPKEKKRIYVELDEKNIKEIKKAIKEVKKLLKTKKPPPVVKIRFCNKCAYFNYCWV